MWVPLILTIQETLARYFAPVDIPEVKTILAIIEHESRGHVHTCREDKGGASRGLMQIWRPNSRCNEADSAEDYNPVLNIQRGMWTLAIQSRWHREHCKTEHDSLMHYCGKGPKCMRFAQEIREMTWHI